MATLEKLMLKKTVLKMKRFNINEFQHLLKILHLNIEWKDIVKHVSDCRLRLNIINIVAVVHHFLKDSDFIEESYHRVLLVDAIFHQSSYWWTVSLDKVHTRLLEKETIRNNIQCMLEKLNINAITYVMKFNKLFWVLIIKGESKKKKNNLKLSSPFFFALAPGKVFHVFYRPSNIDNKLLKIVVSSIGAKNYKPYDLSGKHIQSMVNFLEDKNKENAHMNEQQLFNYKEEDVQEYVKNLFGDKNYVLNQFTINIKTDYSMLGDTIPDNSKISKAKVELNGNNIIDGVKDMMLSGAIQPAYPDWVTKLPVLGKNSVHIDVRSNSQ